MIKFAKIFYKISGIEIDLIKLRPQYEDIIWYLSSKDKTPSKKLTLWALNKVESTKDEDKVIEAFDYIVDNEIDYNKYSIDEIMKMKDKGDVEFKIFDSDTFKYNADKDNIETILKKHNVTLLPRSYGDVILGRGAYGTVLDVLYNGENCALKITRPADIPGYECVKGIRDKCPPEVARHLPKIYVIDSYNKINIIVMEKLEPLSREIKYSIKTGRGTTKYSIKKRRNEFLDKFLYKVIEKSMIENKINTSNIDEIYDKVIESDAFKELYESDELMFEESPVSGSSDFYRMGYGYENLKADEKANNMVIFISNVISRFEDVYDKSYLIMDIRVNLRELSQMYFWPLKISVDEVENIPDYLDSGNEELKSFNNAIKWLNSNANISGDDMHDENVMVRKSDGALVIADVGLFSC